MLYICQSIYACINGSVSGQLSIRDNFCACALTVARPVMPRNGHTLTQRERHHSYPRVLSSGQLQVQDCAAIVSGQNETVSRFLILVPPSHTLVHHLSDILTLIPLLFLNPPCSGKTCISNYPSILWLQVIFSISHEKIPMTISYFDKSSS